MRIAAPHPLQQSEFTHHAACCPLCGQGGGSLRQTLPPASNHSFPALELHATCCSRMGSSIRACTGGQQHDSGGGGRRRRRQQRRWAVNMCDWRRRDRHDICAAHQAGAWGVVCTSGQGSLPCGASMEFRRAPVTSGNDRSQSVNWMQVDEQEQPAAGSAPNECTTVSCPVQALPAASVTVAAEQLDDTTSHCAGGLWKPYTLVRSEKMLFMAPLWWHLCVACSIIICDVRHGARGLQEGMLHSNSSQTANTRRHPAADPPLHPGAGRHAA